MSGNRHDFYLCATVAIFLSGCVNSTPPRVVLSIPVTGQFDDGTALLGQATAMSDGNGIFWVKEPAGIRCDGNYDARNRSPTLVVPVTCSDGSRGETVIARQSDLVSGSAIVALDSGKRGQFVFGNVSFEQKFGSGGIASTN